METPLGASQPPSSRQKLGEKRREKQIDLLQGCELTTYLSYKAKVTVKLFENGLNVTCILLVKV